MSSSYATLLQPVPWQLQYSSALSEINGILRHGFYCMHSSCLVTFGKILTLLSKKCLKSCFCFDLHGCPGLSGTCTCSRPRSRYSLSQGPRIVISEYQVSAYQVSAYQVSAYQVSAYQVSFSTSAEQGPYMSSYRRLCRRITP